MRFKTVQQLQYWQGQSLRSADFNTQLNSDEQLRWLHNRAAHRVFGIGFGLKVQGPVKFTDPNVWSLQYGIAYDCLGRELVVPEDRRFDLPPPGTVQYLSLTWGPVRAQLRWIPENEVGESAGVILARSIPDGKYDPDYHPIRARPLRRPKIAAGSTPPGNTPWERLVVDGRTIGLQTHIDASAAGFISKPLYLASLNWQSKNTQFSPPYVTIADATPRGLTVRLLLREESLKPLSDFRVFPVTGAPFHTLDQVARVQPRFTTAVRIASTEAPNKLTLEQPATALGLNAGDYLALANLPQVFPAKQAARAIQVEDSTAYKKDLIILRRDGTAPGSATKIQDTSADSDPNRLIYPTDEVTDLKPGDFLDLVEFIGTVDSVAGVKVTLKAVPVRAAPGDTVLRMSTAIEAEHTATVVSVTGKTLELSAAIPLLKKNENLGLKTDGSKVKQFTDLLTTDAEGQFRAQDIIRGKDNHATIIDRVDERASGTRLMLRDAISPSEAGTVEIADQGVRSTVSADPGPDFHSIPLRNVVDFAIDDWVALFDPSGPKVFALGEATGVDDRDGTLKIKDEWKDARQGHVVAALRFSAQSKVEDSNPLTVTDPKTFRIGDLVTVADGQLVSCAEVVEVDNANRQLKIRGDLDAKRGDDLKVVSVDTIAQVNAATASSVTLDWDVTARANRRWYAARFDHSVDASRPPAPMEHPAAPDGALAGDPIGFAALTAQQRKLQFGPGVSVREGQSLVIEGADEFTGERVQSGAFVEVISTEQQAVLRIDLPAGAALRPESLSALVGFSDPAANDFAAYSQEQGLAVCWLGCQILPPVDRQQVPEVGGTVSPSSKEQEAMIPSEPSQSTERVRFFDDERLIASDLQALDDFARDMRWLHNRSLHQPGVASGYKVSGEKGDRQVIVQPGYAIDRFGREIVLSRTYALPIPPEAGDGKGGPAFFDLTVAYPDELEETELRGAECPGAVPGAVRVVATPNFCWVAAVGPTPSPNGSQAAAVPLPKATGSGAEQLQQDVASGLRIILARAEVINCQLNRRISTAPRQDARPGAHPFVFSEAAAPDWQVDTDNPFGIEATAPVDTGAAGFRTPPCYFASLASAPEIKLTGGRTLHLEVVVSVSNPGTEGFQISLLFPSGTIPANDLPDAKANLKKTKWTIEWMGVEA